MKIAAIVIGCLLVLAGGFVWWAFRTFTPDRVMAEYARDAVVQARTIFQIDLDFSEGSIARIEEIAARQYREISSGVLPVEETLQRSSIAWGAYLGEVMRKHKGGSWRIPQDGPYKGIYVLEFPGGGQVSPPAKVHGRLTNGDEDNLELYYRVVSGQLAGNR
jgi:hypothetical protein